MKREITNNIFLLFKKNQELNHTVHVRLRQKRVPVHTASGERFDLWVEGKQGKCLFLHSYCRLPTELAAFWFKFIAPCKELLVVVFVVVLLSP